MIETIDVDYMNKKQNLMLYTKENNSNFCMIIKSLIENSLLFLQMKSVLKKLNIRIKINIEDQKTKSLKKT